MKPLSLFLLVSCFTFLLHAQHDAQRNAVIALAKGDDAKFSQEFLNPRVDAGMNETRMVNLLRLLRKDQVDEALACADMAVEHGMDPARILAGSGAELSKLRAHPKFEELRGIDEVGPFIHGPMVGNVTDTSASIWVRTNGPRNVGATWWSKGGKKGGAGGGTGGNLMSDAANDFVVKLKVEGLEPNTRYEGDVLSEGVSSGTFSFQTRLAPGSSTKAKVAFGGGAGYVPEYHGMWDTIKSRQPDALLMLGDNVYIDDPEHVVTQHYCYYRRQSEPGWRSLVSQVPVYSIYDDHDFGDNDVMAGPAIDKPAWKRPVVEVFEQNWVNPGYGGGKENPGCWYSFTIGDIDFFLLDGRYYRHRDSGSMLGAVQKAWLLDGLKKSKATFKAIVSPVPFTPGVKPGSRDTWDGYDEEREELFSFIETEKIDGVFLVSADRHRTDLRTIARENGPPFYEFMSSRLTNRHVHSVIKTPGLIWGYNETCSFGLMEFDTTKDTPEVIFRCIDIEGKEHHSFTFEAKMADR